MLSRRVVVCLDVLDGRVVKGVAFQSLRDAGDPVELAAAYERAGADEIVFLDIGASPEQRHTMLDVARGQFGARVLESLLTIALKPSGNFYDTNPALTGKVLRYDTMLKVWYDGQLIFMSKPDAALALLKARGLDVPFISVSGTMGEDVAVDAMRLGVHDYLLKGDVITADVVDTWIEHKTSKEIDAERLRPHPLEFSLYYDC